ncbi:MAG: nucleotidyltransferase domain-containing protein [Deltaproteobacteria bacterium]
MEDVAEIVAGARALYGTRLLGVALFGSRVGGQPREDSDLDIAVWLEPGFTRSTSWLPWSSTSATTTRPSTRPS